MQLLRKLTSLCQ